MVACPIHTHGRDRRTRRILSSLKTTIAAAPVAIGAVLMTLHSAAHTYAFHCAPVCLCTCAGHLQQLEGAHPLDVWAPTRSPSHDGAGATDVAPSDEQEDARSSSSVEGPCSVRWQLQWGALTLGDAHHVAALQRILAEKLSAAQPLHNGSSLACDVQTAGSLGPAQLPANVVQHLQRWEIHEALLYRGLVSAGELLCALYLYCPEVLQVTRLVHEYAQHCEDGLQLLCSSMPTPDTPAEARPGPGSGSGSSVQGASNLLRKLAGLEDWSFGQVGALLHAQQQRLAAADGARGVDAVASLSAVACELQQVSK